MLTRRLPIVDARGQLDVLPWRACHLLVNGIASDFGTAPISRRRLELLSPFMGLRNRKSVVLYERRLRAGIDKFDETFAP